MMFGSPHLVVRCGRACLEILSLRAILSKDVCKSAPRWALQPKMAPCCAFGTLREYVRADGGDALFRIFSRLLGGGEA